MSNISDYSNCAADRAMVAELSAVIRGRVWLPGDADFDLARRPWNLAVDQPVAAVVEAEDAADVAAAVRFAADTELGITAQPSGHGATGRTAGTILLRTHRLDAIEIYAASRRARIGAGVQSGALQQAAAAHGLTGLPGSSPVVSVAGVALGGGLSWFGRSFGWVADSVSAFDIVDAQGKARVVTADDQPELFWALRGGGGDYAIVTALELALHPAPRVFGGRMLWHGSHARAVAETYRAITLEAPDELTLWLELLHFPGAEPMIAIDSTYLGTAAEARACTAAMDGLPEPLSDTRRDMSVAELGSITAEPTEPGPGRSRGELLTALDDAALDALLADPIAPLMTVQIRHLGGALAQPSDSPHGSLTEPYAVYMFGVPSDPATAAAISAKQGSLASCLPVSGGKPLTFLNPTESITAALPATSIERLRRVKAVHDPARTIRANFSAMA